MSKNLSALPKKSRNGTDILNEMKNLGNGDAKWREGKTWSLIYYVDQEHTNFLKEAHNLFLSENFLNPMAFLSLKKFETDIIRMTADLLNGGKNAVGSITSGGTESILLAIKTYRDYAKKKRPWIVRPNIIVPETIHVAFEKAAKYFNVKIIHAPLKKDYTVDVNKVKKLINKNTILLVGSAPNYPQGVIDPIEELSKLALQKNLPLHVDACLGGFFLPFLKMLGYNIPKFDFSLPGVTSISADVHKYGYAAKGASTILYKSMTYMKHQFFVYENWPGGVYAGPGILGTRAGGPIASAWASMNKMGEEGYKNLAKVVMETTNKLINGINTIPELEIMGKPVMGVIGYRSNSKKVNIYAVGEIMEQKGWNVDRLQKPEGLHAMVSPIHEKYVGQYLEDLKTSVAKVLANPGLATSGGAAMYGMIAKIPLRSMVKSTIAKMMEDMYEVSGKMPDLNDTDIREEKNITMTLGKYYLKIIEYFARVREKSSDHNLD
ncbi:MAG: aspartate aminotransferase family protein [Desulfobacteraceae bacterium]|nr:aspartate aminotransferase family protein [Desulfobacteraceae bacterium]